MRYSLHKKVGRMLKKAALFLFIVSVFTNLIPLLYGYAAAEQTGEPTGLIAHYPLNKEYQYANKLNPAQKLAGDSPVWNTDYVSLINPGNSNNGHIAGKNPGAAVTGRTLSVSLDIKLNGKQTRTVSAANTLLAYGASEASSLTLRPYYAQGKAAVVVKQGGQEAIAAVFTAPAADMWHNYTISLDGSANGRLIVWVDGVKAAEMPSKGLGADEIGNDQFRLNRTLSTFSNLDSHYRDVRVYNQALDGNAAAYLAQEIRSFAWQDLLAAKLLTDQAEVRNNLALLRDPNLVWSSSDPSVIDPGTGQVTRPAKNAEPAVVVLTLSWFDYSQAYTVNVPPEDAGDYLIADFDFENTDSGIVGSTAKAAVQGKAAYADSFAGSGKAANIGSAFWLNITRTDGTPLLAGLNELTLSYDSRTTGGSGWAFFAAPNTAAQTVQNERYLGVIDKTNSVTVERYLNNGSRPENPTAASGSEWKHVDVVVSAANTQLYVDGALVSTQASSKALKDILGTSGGVLQIGKGNWGTGEYYAGLIDNFKIFNRALTQEEMLEYRITNIAPTLSPAAGQVYSSVKLSHPAGTQYLYYTTDGSDPTLQSTPYAGPFKLRENSTVKAAAIAPNGSRSKIVTAAYYGSDWSATANAFRLDGQNTVNNVKVTWPTLDGAEYYEVYRSDKRVGSTTGDTLDDYGLVLDADYAYTVKAVQNGSVMDTAQTNTIRTFAYDPSAISKKKDNYTGASTLTEGEPYGIKVGSTWYHYVYKKETVSGTVTTRIYEQTAADGHTYGSDRLLGSFEDMRVEGEGYVLNPHSGKVVLFAHEEASSGYTRAAVFLASVTPGGGDFAAGFRDRPFEQDARDMSLFVDDDQAAYLVFATRGNNDISIVALDDDWQQPEQLVNTVFVGKHKESPTLVKYENRYYFFGSTANGWYPSQAEYASASTLGGDWTPLRPIGNAASFATQANGYASWTDADGHMAFAGNGYHWGNQYADNFKDPMGTYARLFPMVFHDGIATADWFHQLDLDDVHGMIPVQAGQNLSLGKPVEDSQGLNAAAATDGADLASSPRVQHSSANYQMTVDLQQYAHLAEINLTTRSVGGSDTVYRYKLEGSADKADWNLLVDGSTNNVSGFITHPISDSGHYRYVRLSVSRVINVHNGQDAIWADGIIELAVFGASYVDKSALENAYALNKDTVRGGYTQGTWNTISGALRNAESLLQQENATQWEVDRAVLRIEEAYKWAQTVHPEQVIDYSSAGVPVSELWYDTEGNPIQAHGGGFLQQTADDGKPIYYWVGENKIHNRAAFYAVSLYSSRDLANWTNEGNILNQFAETADGAEYGLLDSKWERPKLLYNAKTGKYVLYGHWETAGSYATSQIAVATADQPAGPYTFLGHWRPGGTLHNWRSDGGIYTDSEFYKTSGTKTPVAADIQADTSQMGYVSRDFTVFAEDDGTAYLVSAEGHSMRVHRLNEDYTDVDFTTYPFSDPSDKSTEFESYSFYDNVGREAPAVVRADDGYYMISSGQSGWLPNQGTISYNADLTDPGGWTPVKENGRILEKYAFGSNSTYYSQPTNIMKLTGEDGSNSYVYMGDQWRSSQLSDSRYVWLPITFNADHSGSIAYTPGWKLDAATGSVQLPDVELVSQGKPASMTNNDGVTGIEKANDGYLFNLNTSGDSTHFFGGLAAPYEYTLDLEEIYDLARIDVSYRLYNGSEMYHRYQIFGSTDGQNWTELVKNDSNMWAGFNSDRLSGSYRYVKLKVNEVRRVNNNALSNGWGSGLVEVQVYAKGEEAGATAMPTADLDSGSYAYLQSVVLTHPSADARIHYTLDGSTPSEASPLYEEALVLPSGDTVLKAIAVANGTRSEVLERSYHLQSASAPLNVAIETAQALVQTEYTESSWAILDSALQRAIAVRDNPDSTESLRLAALNDLLAAYDALERSQTPPTQQPAVLAEPQQVAGGQTFELLLNMNVEAGAYIRELGMEYAPSSL